MIEHGTLSCYTKGCRRPECRQAAREYEQRRRRRLVELRIAPGYRAASRHWLKERSDLVVCTCWCEEHLVWITPEDLIEGRTYTCGRPPCQPPESL